MRGQPRIQYKREYWVYPTDATEERRVQIATWAAEAQVTCGPSYDDAGIGDLDVRRVVLWDIPDGKALEFLEWYKLYYPGVVVDFRGSDNWPAPFPDPFEVEYEADTLPKHSTLSYTSRALSDINEIIIHHTVTGGGYHYVLAIANYHVTERGWPGIGYHYCITEDGRIIQTNDLTTVSYHAYSNDSKTIGIALLGEFSAAPPTDIQMQAAIWLVQRLTVAVPTIATILPHHLSPGSSTSCPGNTYPSWFWKLTRNQIEGEIEPPTPAPPPPNPEPPPPPPPGLGDIPKVLGLHASTDPWISEQEFAEFRTLKPGVIKTLSTIEESHARRLGQEHPNAVRVVRAFLSFGGRNVSPQQFVDWTLSDVKRTANALGGDVWVELHNEPNLASEGLFSSWSNGREFGVWLAEVVRLYRNNWPGVKLLSPGLSPGVGLNGIRSEYTSFVNDGYAGFAACDGIGIHAYWSPSVPMGMEAVPVVDWFSGRFQNYPKIVTEASNNGVASWDTKASEYVAFARLLSKNGLMVGVTYFVASSSNADFKNEVWVGNNVASKIIGLLGNG